jgi:hypothetical protein
MNLELSSEIDMSVSFSVNYTNHKTIYELQ